MSHRNVKLCAAGACIALWGGAFLAHAETATVSAVLSSDVIQVSKFALQRDTMSSTRGSLAGMMFDRFDADDVSDGLRHFMYAPYRSEGGRSWHVANVTGNGSALTISTAIDGYIGGKPLAVVLEVFCEGLMPSQGSGPVPGTSSVAWEPLQGFTRRVTGAFNGVMPLRYRLNVSGLSSGSYSGTVTYALTVTP